MSAPPGDGGAVAEELVHASCVAVARADGGVGGVLILGASGAGKSALALRLIARGAGLVADDRTLIRRREGKLLAVAPRGTRGVIEARGVGLIRLPVVDEAEIGLVVSLAPAPPAPEDPGGAGVERLPPRRFAPFLGLQLPLVCGNNAPEFDAVVFLLAQSGQLLDPDAGLDAQEYEPS